jgi:hypothetical protein
MGGGVTSSISNEGDHMKAKGSAFSRRLRAGVSQQALAAGSAAGDLRSGNDPRAGIASRNFSGRLTAAFAVLSLMTIAPTAPSHAQAPPLGTAASFGVLAGSEITTTGQLSSPEILG